MTAIPKIAGATIDPPGTPFEIQSIRPAADVRVSELTENSITRDDLKGGEIDLAGSTWRIESTLPRPSPDGDPFGKDPFRAQLAYVRLPLSDSNANRIEGRRH